MAVVRKVKGPLLVVGTWLVYAGATAQLGAADAKSADFFEREVRPVLARHCYQCHSDRATAVFGELRLDSGPALERGGRSGPVLVPGDPDSSRLIRAVRHEPDVVSMPPSGRLGAREIESLVEWVRSGAQWPEVQLGGRSDVLEGRDADPGLGHWAWQPIVAPPAPEVSDRAWPRGPIDRFVLARLEARGLAPAGAAGRHTMLRRLSLDLTGLPMAPSKVRAFADADWPGGLEAAVDDLLASHAFGERWGRHWLDLAGYADTLGLGRRIPARHAWRYRDYVIGAFNRDKPYDQFVREQVAGDVLEFEDDIRRREQVVATGLLAIGPWALVDQDKEQLRMDVVDHQLDTVGRAFLGLTVGCARCHDHKFDPLPQREYYAMAGIFASTRTLDSRMSGVFSDVQRTLLPETPQELIARGEALRSWEREYRDALDDQRRSEERVRTLEQEVETAAKAESGSDSDLKERLAAARKESRGQASEALRILHYVKPVPPAALALADDPEPANTRIRLGGNPHSHGDEVPRGFLSLVPLESSPKIANRRLIGTGFQKSSGRLELASWLTDPGNPLPARVIVNRIWHHLFGRGIVASVDNFGLLGERPTHPQLLDHLAVRLRELDWSVKALVREIVLSRTYGMSALHDERAAAADPENRLLWRSNRRRLEAETIRDSLLFVSGSLDVRAGGPSLPLSSRGSVVMGQPPLLAANLEMTDSIRFRRTVYLPMLRKSQLREVDVLNLFDFPDPNTVKGGRDVTTVPTQALYLMNSPFLIDQARAAADALLAMDGRSDRDRVREFLMRSLGRPATEEDFRRAARFLRDAEPSLGREEAWARYCQAVLVSNEFLFRA